MKRISAMLNLLWKFIFTEIIGGLELIFWKKITLVISSITIKNDILGFKPALYLLVVSIPLIFALYEFRENENDIKHAWNVLIKS